MQITYPPTALGSLMLEALEKISYARHLSSLTGAKKELLDLYDEVEGEIRTLQSTLNKNKFSTEYVDDLIRSLDRCILAFPRGYSPENVLKEITLQESEKPAFKHQMEQDEPAIREALARFKNVFSFFSKFNFLNNHLVVVGANGSGKTLLANELKRHIRNHGVLISAQRILAIPDFEDIKSTQITRPQLKRVQVVDKTNKTLNLEDSTNEFEILLRNIIAEHAEYALKQLNEAPQQKGGKDEVGASKTNLQKLIAIWNELFVKPTIDCVDGITIVAKNMDGSYPLIQMSEGEKVALFLTAHVLQCPENGFVIVDEPEMHFHPTIHKRLWDKLERERPDAKFIYFTHDLEFASSRAGMKKLWLRMVNYPNNFVLEEITTEEIPEVLLLELLGSRQNILFCEGEPGKIDAQIYQILFPDYIIKPVLRCGNVINYTKAFNEIKNQPIKAIGVIDADHQPQSRLTELKKKNIYGLKLAEVENLLFDENLLFAVCSDLGLQSTKVQKIKEQVLKSLKQLKNLQISQFVSTRLDNYLKDNNFDRGTTIDALTMNFRKYLDGINLSQWTDEREKEIDAIILNNDYNAAIKIFNNKGLIEMANTIFGIKNFKDRAISTLAQEPDLQRILINYFPKFEV